jgi:hypothetical protein
VTPTKPYFRMKKRQFLGAAAPWALYHIEVLA